MTISHWSFFRQSRQGFFLSTATPFPTFFILAILLDKCQTKSFEDMNVLIKAILKFCTTNQLFRILSNSRFCFSGFCSLRDFLLREFFDFWILYVNGPNQQESTKYCIFFKLQCIDIFSMQIEKEICDFLHVY